MTAMKFTYRSGQRPLDGFTLKRGVGQGGFGEVYFAVSDGGKEVALKLLRGHTDAELRGIAHCLNLKHPNLVHLYDLRTDGRGEQWVVMEYVFGESLAQVINRHPTGLPTELIREWFAALARGVGYLHDQGVVHRDLKPANIFIEHGHLKIGDYGLSRRMSSSERGELTRGVGTPHYMAPEIKNGNYSRSHRRLRVRRHPLRDAHRPPAVRRRDAGRGADEAPARRARPEASCRPRSRAVLERALEKDPAKRYAVDDGVGPGGRGGVRRAARMRNGATVAPHPAASIAKTPDAPTPWWTRSCRVPTRRSDPVARPRREAVRRRVPFAND